MSKARAGIVAVASRDESGGQRADGFILDAKKQLIEAGVDVVCADTVVWNPADALDVCKQFNEAGIDSLIVINATWVLDSLTYILAHNISAPLVLWAVPYTETFSLACVQHMGAVLKSQGIPYQYVYGLPTDKALIEKLKKVTEVGHIIHLVKNMNLALMGPRQTWRVAGAQDMSNEEWEFSEKFGTTIIHLEMDEILSRVDAITDEQAFKTLASLDSRTGKAVCSEANMIYAAKVYMALKDVMKKNHLNAVAAECYPKFDGLMNLTASWMADEGVVVETEGDISHVMLREILNKCSSEGVSLLGEVGSFDADTNVMSLSHGGSSGHFTADSVERVQISHSGEIGTFVGTPVKAMKIVTVANMTGKEGCYKMLISKAETLPVSDEEWEKAGKRLLVKLKFQKDVTEMMDDMLKAGVDHHLIIREGDYTKTLALLCDYMGVEKVIL